MILRLRPGHLRVFAKKCLAKTALGNSLVLRRNTSKAQ